MIITGDATGRTHYEAPGYHERARTNGTELAYKVQGAGEPVILIHGAIIPDSFEPLLAQPLVRERYRFVSYHRRGYGASARPEGPVSLQEQAADVAALMNHLGIERAHIVGHSYGGSIALQLALDHPEIVHSLAVLEPALMTTPSGPEFGVRTVEPAYAAYGSGDRARALDIFMRGVEGPRYREHVGPGLPAGAWEQALTDVDTLFQVELPALLQWTFGQTEAGRITQPVLSIAGSETTPAIRESHAVVLSWFPQAEPAVIENATHALQMMNPRGVAEVLDGFFARHPLIFARGHRHD